MAARSTANRSAADMISTPLSCAATRRSAGRHGYVSTILVAVSLCLPAADVKEIADQAKEEMKKLKTE